jgi:oligopeptidase A
MSAPDNPLLEDAFPIAFDRFRADRVVPTVDRLLAEAQERLDAVGAETAPPTFDNTMLWLEELTKRLDRCMAIVGHLENVSTSDELREAINVAQPRVSEFMSKLPLSEALWARVKRYAASPEAAQLSGARKRFLDKTVASFRRHGADLDAAGKARLAQIDVELSRLTLRYSQNVLDSLNAFELVIDDEARLAGLPESALRAARESAGARGVAGYRFTLQPPSYMPALRFADDASIRERLYRALYSAATSGAHDNRALVSDILALRAERARLLGYASFADLVLEDRMAQRGERARRFVDDLRRRTEAAFAREKAELAAWKAQLGGGPLEPWDVAYVAEKLRKQRYAFDEETLRPFFGFESVVRGLFQIAERMYRIRFEPWSEAPRWHDSVRAYKVIDDASGEWLAGMYFDPFPRESKKSGAWAHGVLGRGRLENDRRHIAVMVANVTPPLQGEEAQLSHREVETLFHEFGHLMHHCLSRTELRSHVGTSVAWDFVELPSQIMENWCWEREALDLFARHRDTGEPIPDDLFQAMCRARRFQAASQQMRQLGFASMDLALHVDYDPASHGDPITFARSVMQPFSSAPLPDDWAMIASFEHLFGDPVGYGAAYYSYKWAEVLDADAFTRFKREGLFDPQVGAAFRANILARGDEADAAELYRSFMGRDPEDAALLERLGLLDPAA